MSHCAKKVTGLLDLKTLILVHAALSALFAALFYFRYRQFPQFKSIKYWAIGGGLLAGGGLISLASGTNLLRSLVPSTAILITVVNGCYLTSRMFMLHGFGIWKGRPVPYRFSLSILFLFWTPIFFMAYSSSYLEFRNILNSLCLAIYSLSIVWVLLSDYDRKNTGEKLNVFLNCLHFILLIVRIIHILFVEPDSTQFMESSSLHDTVFFAVSIVLYAGSATACLMMVASRQQNELTQQMQNMFEANQAGENVMREQRDLITIMKDTQNRRQDGTTTADKWRYSFKEWTIINPSGDVITLTNAENNVFCCLAKHLNKAVSRKELYGSLGKKDFDYEDNSLTILIHRLRKKFSGQNEAIQIKSIRGIGYQLSGDFVAL